MTGITRHALFFVIILIFPGNIKAHPGKIVKSFLLNRSVSSDDNIEITDISDFLRIAYLDNSN